MVDQDELVQVGFETTMFEESMVQDDNFEGDRSLQPYPEVTLGATSTTTMLGDPHHQISLTEDLAIPMESTPDHSISASPKPFDMNQMLEMMKQMMDQQSGLRSDMQAEQNQQKGDMQKLAEDMPVMGDGIREEMKAGQEELKAGLAEVKGVMQNTDQNFANAIRTVHEGMTGFKENVKGGWTAMKTGKEEVTNKIMAVKREVYKLGQGMMEITKGQLEAEIGKYTNAKQFFFKGQQETKGGIWGRQGGISRDTKRHGTGE